MNNTAALQRKVRGQRMGREDSIENRSSGLRQSVLFNGVFAIAAVCIAGSLIRLPFLPTQDGAVHLYYAHVLNDLLHSGQTFASSFSIRSVLPPYSFHWYLLILLSSLVSPLLAERIVAALAVLWLCFGFWRLVRSLNNNSPAAILLFLPFAASWPLYMGLFNFTLGSGTLLFLMGWWLDNEQRLNAWRGAIFISLVFLLASMHPVPVLMFFLFAGVLLAVQAIGSYRTARETPARDWISKFFKAKVVTLTCLALSCSVLLWIGSVTDKARVNFQPSGIHQIGVRLASLITLHELSPLAITQWRYTASLVVVMLVSIVIAGYALRKRASEPRFQAVLWTAVACLVLYLIVPRQMNGSYLFEKRFSFVFCLLVVALASGARLSRTQSLLISLVPLTSLCLIVGMQREFNLANIARLSPIMDAPRLRPGSRVLAIRVGPVRYDTLHYDPDTTAVSYWCLRSDAVLINMAWMELKIIPLKPANSDMPLLDFFDAARLVRSAIDKGSPLPLQPDAVVFPRTEATGIEDEMVRKLRVTYGYSLLSDSQSRFVLLARPQALRNFVPAPTLTTDNTGVTRVL